jgi:hypothetical protein
MDRTSGVMDLELAGKVEPRIGRPPGRSARERTPFRGATIAGAKRAVEREISPRLAARFLDRMTAIFLIVWEIRRFSRLKAEPPSAPGVSPSGPARQPLGPAGKTGAADGVDKSRLTHPEPRRFRDKEHVKFVAKQTCLICRRRPADAHHLRFAQHRALGYLNKKNWAEYYLSLFDGGNATGWLNAKVSIQYAANQCNADYVDILPDLKDEDSAHLWVTIGKLASYCRSHGIVLVVANLPELHDVHHYRFEQISKLAPEDPHPNSRAHDLIARGLYRALKSFNDVSPALARTIGPGFWRQVQQG